MPLVFKILEWLAMLVEFVESGLNKQKKAWTVFLARQELLQPGRQEKIVRIAVFLIVLSMAAIIVIAFTLFSEHMFHQHMLQTSPVQTEHP